MASAETVISSIKFPEAKYMIDKHSFNIKEIIDYKLVQVTVIFKFLLKEDKFF